MFSSNTSQVSNDAVFVEDIFSTTLYTGNGSTTTINNGIDVSGEGGLVWVKARGNGNRSHTLFDSATYTTGQYYLATNITNGFLDTGVAGTFALNNDGFSVAGTSAQWNASGELFASWTFRKQKKFFDVVTFSTTTGSSVPITVNHNLGAVPGCIIVKQTNGAADWFVYHRSLGSSQYLALNSTDFAQNGGTSKWYSTPTSTSFTLGGDFVQNATYVAYLFAHNAGGFGLTGTDNVISCGSFDGATGTTVTLGYEPQWIMFKNTTNASNWQIVDNMRGMPVGSDDRQLMANLANAESDNGLTSPTATGFIWNPSAAGNTYIYIAIRRGPMKVPTDATKVFSPVARAGTSSTATVTAGFPVDMTIIQDRTQNSFAAPFDRLRGATYRLFTALTAAEASEPTTLTSFAVQDGFTLGTDLGAGFVNTSGDNYINWNFRRAPSTFDEVVSDQTGVLNHNLGVTPELIIYKVRNYSPQDWFVDVPSLGATRTLNLNTTGAASSTNYITSPTATQFTTGVGGGGYSYVYYLWATNAGVTKVGTYTGNGSSQTINCGFTGGARFVMIKATSTTGNWLVADSARGIVSGNDPALYLNSTSAEVTGFDWIDADNSGFIVNETSTIAANTNGVQYLFLAYA